MLFKGTGALVTTKWLHNLVKNGLPKELRLLDSSWHLPSTKRVGRDEYREKHIPGAAFFDIDECCDKASPYSHMLPELKQFEQYVGDLGIDEGSHIIVYDNSDNFGFFSAPRVWWMFKIFGIDKVSVLDGGFAKWCLEGLPTTPEIPNYPKTIFHGLFQPQMIKYYEDIKHNLNDNSFQLIDARSEGRFKGTQPEPREGIDPGHIPGAKNLCFRNIVDPTVGEMVDKEKLERLFSEAGVDLSKPLVATCGSGVTACCLSFAAYTFGKDVPIYDGSWTEWFLKSPPELRESESKAK